MGLLAVVLIMFVAGALICILAAFLDRADRQEEKPVAKSPPTIEISETYSIEVTFRSGDSSSVNEDNWRFEYLKGHDDELPISADAELVYTDSNGTESERKITVNSLVPWGSKDYALLAFCHLRKEQRTFLVSRIKQYVHMPTGEVIPDVPLFMKSLFDSSPAGKISSLLKDDWNEVVVMLFVSKADGRLMPNERKEIIDFFRRTGKQPHVTDGQIEDELRELRKPTALDFRSALSHLAKASNDDRYKIVDVLYRIASTKKNPDSLTMAAVELAERNLRNVS